MHDTITWSSRLNSPQALPLVLMDTSALLNMARICNANDHMMPPSDHTRHAQSVTEMIEALLDGNRRTIVLPRRILIESLSTTTGRLDLERLSNGSLKLPEGLHPSEFYADHIGNAEIYYMLQHFQQEQRLRCYPSIESMFAAGEVEHPKGGIIIVDTEKHVPYYPNGRLPQRAKDLTRLHAFGMRDWYHAHPEDFEQEPTIMSTYEYPEPYQGPRLHQDHGDRCLLDLSAALIERAGKRGSPHRFLVVNNDGRLNEKFSEQWESLILSGKLPFMTKTHELLAGMAMYTRANDYAYSPESASVHLAASARFVEQKAFERMQIESMQRQFGRNVKTLKDWLESTSHPHAEWAALR